MAIPHTEELLEWLLLFIAMLGATAASVKSRHITIDALSHVLSDSWRRRAGLAAQLFALLVCVVLLLITGGYWIESMGYGETAVGGMPRWALEAIMPAAFAVMSAAHFGHMLSILRRKPPDAAGAAHRPPGEG